MTLSATIGVGAIWGPSWYRDPHPHITSVLGARVPINLSDMTTPVGIKPLGPRGIESLHVTSQRCVSGTCHHFEQQNIIRTYIYDCVCVRVRVMVKSCCAVGFANRYFKGCGLKFYRFPTDPERRMRWVAAVDRKNWTPTEYSWLCSARFIRGVKSNDPTCPDYVPSVFSHIDTPKKKRAQHWAKNGISYYR